MISTKFLFWSSVFFCLTLLISISCSVPDGDERAAELYSSYCGSCHLLPSIDDLPKQIWANNVLPEMGAKMGLRDSTYDPYQGLSFRQKEAVMRTGHYPSQPMMKAEDWQLLKEYIIRLAPDSLEMPTLPPADTLDLFDPTPVAIDSQNGALVAFLEYNSDRKEIMVATLSGELMTYDYSNQSIQVLSYFGNPMTSYTNSKDHSYATLIGILNPSELKSGQLLRLENDSTVVIASELHRPVHTLVHDLNGDGKDEIVISEFGHLTGQLTLLLENETGSFDQQVLHPLPGVIRVIAQDMNADGKDDLVFLASQSWEGVYILYQEEDLKFRSEKVIGFNPVYGSSWFELMDYDGDGDQDIVTVNGDNADYSVVPKPYHGLRLFLNDGENHFEERFFYPLAGATRVVARDFDQDGDIDFGVIATFPEYGRAADRSFVYLDNQNTELPSFKTKTFDQSNQGRWLLMEAGDIDQDGDEDIILSSFTYSFVPVPQELMQQWMQSNVDLMILDNMHKQE